MMENELEGLEEVVEEPEVEAEPEEEKVLCGHVNAHSYGVDNAPDELACTLLKGHEGNHKALHLEKDPHNPDVTVEVEREWMDAAGKDYVAPPPKPPKWTDGATDGVEWVEEE